MHSGEPSSLWSADNFSSLLIDGFLTECDTAGMPKPPPIEDEEDEAPLWPNRIREFRKRRRWSLHHLAAESGVSFQTLQRWEKKHPKLPLSKVAGVASALGVSAGDLLPYELEVTEELAFIVERYKAADAETRRMMVKSVKGLTDNDGMGFDVRREPSKPARK